MSDKEKFNVYKAVTQNIVLRLAEGDIPWRKPWCSPIGDGKINYVSRKPYHGVNLLLLTQGGEYLTFKQALDAGGNVRKGEHGTLVFKWIPFIPKDRKEEAERLEAAGLSTSHLQAFKTGWDKVFHLSQTENIATKIEQSGYKRSDKPTDIARFVIERYMEQHGAALDERPCDEVTYDTATGIHTVPLRGQFRQEESWYESVFGLIVRSASEKIREQGEAPRPADRKDTVKKELAEAIGAAMCMAAVGLENRLTREETAAECARWTAEFNRDYTLVVQASAAAEKAARYILRPITE